MHDPTEGGLAGALWELSAACGYSVVVELEKVTIPALSARICRLLEIDPLAAIASGALLLTSPQPDAQHIQAALENNGIRCGDIGWIEKGQVGVWQIHQGLRSPLNRPARDEIARLLES
jgi:hydrogenase maturation factor